MKGFLIVVSVTAAAAGVIFGLTSIISMAEHGLALTIHGEPITDVWLVVVASGLSLFFGISLLTALFLLSERNTLQKEAGERQKVLGSKCRLVDIFLDRDKVLRVLVRLAREVEVVLNAEEAARKEWTPPGHAPRNDQYRFVLLALSHRRSESVKSLDRFEQARYLASAQGFTFPAETWEQFLVLAGAKRGVDAETGFPAVNFVKDKTVMSGLFTFRPVRDDDSAALIELIGDCWAEYPGCILDVQNEETWLLAPATYYRKLFGGFWVVEQDGQVCACIGAKYHPDGTAEPKSLYVAKRARRRGLATRLMALVESRSRAAGLTSIVAWSDTRFTTAHDMYEHRLGYTRTGRTRDLNDISNSVEYEFVKEL